MGFSKAVLVKSPSKHYKILWKNNMVLSSDKVVKKHQKLGYHNLLSQISQNVQRLQEETDVLMTSLNGSDMTHSRPYVQPQHYSRSYKQPVDIANWSDDPHYTNAWVPHPATAWNENNKRIETSDIQSSPIRQQQKTIQKTSALRQFDASEWKDGEVFKQSKGPVVYQENINHQRPTHVRYADVPKPTSTFVAHQKQRPIHPQNINNVLLEKVNRPEDAFLDETYSKGWQRKYTICSRCNKDIFSTDLITVQGQHLHKWCVKCKECWITLDNLKDGRELRGEMFCNRCYSNLKNQQNASSLVHNRYTAESSPRQNNVGQKLFWNNNNAMFNREYFQSDSTLASRVYSQGVLYENKDSILDNTFYQQKRKPIKGILKQKLLPSPRSLTMETNPSHKPYMNPVTQSYLHELEQKTIRYDPDEIENTDQISTRINMKKNQDHISDEKLGMTHQGRHDSKQYESVLNAARDSWIPHYGVSNDVSHLKHNEEVPINGSRNDVNLSDYVNKLDNSMEQEDENKDRSVGDGEEEIDDNKYSAAEQNITKTESESLADFHLKYDTKKDNVNDIKKNQNGAYSSQHHEDDVSNKRHLDSYQNKDDFISSDIIDVTDNNQKERGSSKEVKEVIHTSSTEKQIEEPVYSEIETKTERKKVPKTVSFSSKTTEITKQPTVLEFKVSAKNRFYSAKGDETSSVTSSVVDHQNLDDITENKQDEETAINIINETSTKTNSLKQNEPSTDLPAVVEKEIATETSSSNVTEEKKDRKSSYTNVMLSRGNGHIKTPHDLINNNSPSKGETKPRSRSRSSSVLMYPSQNHQNPSPRQHQQQTPSSNGEVLRSNSSRNTSVSETRRSIEPVQNSYMRYDEMIASRNTEKYGLKPQKKKSWWKKIFGGNNKKQSFNMNTSNTYTRRRTDDFL